MKFSSKWNIARIFLLLALLVPAWSTFAAETAYKITILPSVQTPLGTFDFFREARMNDVGQVCGIAMLQQNFVGYLYTPGQGTKFIDPSGLVQVDFSQLLINNKGVVVGRDFGELKYGVFSYDPQRGYESLRKNLTSSELRSFRLKDMNDSGTILANGPGKNGRPSPWRYTSAAGRWDNLTSIINPLKRFSKYGCTPLQINENGDFTFYNNELDGTHTYVYYAKSDTVVDLSQFNRDLGGSRYIIPSFPDLNDLGWVAGTKYVYTDQPVTKAVAAQPYIFVPGAGIRILRLPIKSPIIAAFDIAADGTVGGWIEKQGVVTALYTYNQNTGYRVVNEERFRAMLPSDMRFTGLDMRPMNDRKEFIGGIYAVEIGSGEEGPRVWFLYSPQDGLRDLQKIVDQLQSNLKINSVEHINNRGQILITVERGGSSKSIAILSPSN